MARRFLLSIGLTLGAVALSVVGCRGKVDECNSLIRVINENHTGDDRPDQGDHLLEQMKRNLDDDQKSIAALSIMSPNVAEIRQLRNDFQAGFKTRIEGEQILVDSAGASPPDLDKARLGLARVNASVPLIKAAYDGARAFCKEN